MNKSGCENTINLQGVLGSSPGQVMCYFLPFDIWWPVWVPAWAVISKGTVLLVSIMVPSRFGDKSICDTYFS